MKESNNASPSVTRSRSNLDRGYIKQVIRVRLAVAARANSVFIKVPIAPN